jgi:hypothetical protein
MLSEEERDFVLETFEAARCAALCAQQSAHKANISLNKRETFQAYSDAEESSSKVDKALDLAMSILFPHLEEE